VLNRVRGPFNVSSAAQAAGVAALEDLSFTDKARAHNDVWMPWFSEQVKALGLEALPSVGNFVLVKFPSGAKSAAAANAHLNKDGIIPRAVANYGLPDFIRFTIGTEEEMRAVVASLAAFMKA
jgi:histidinol-phosphate aminotransferase